ncbi:MAG: hypothetical protein IJL85_06015 [Erysipelotrichaceae bacterium]|nr:hypothetical protein [Erysipelotrichaceae bacterium]
MMNLSAAILNDYAYPDLNADELLKKAATEDDRVFVVLDDDPTGVQCVHDINVYTEWSYETMREAMRKEKLFFLLTNSRSLSAEKSKQMHQEIAETIAAAAKKTKRNYLLVSRSDSTLRGHYPLETDILSEQLIRDYGKLDGEILFPFFKEGGRYTINNIHYIRYGNELIPCAESEFALDTTFSYKSSDLCEYIEEKTEGRYRKEDVMCFSLEELRKADINELTQKLLTASDGRKIVVNAIDYIDVKIFCIALFNALKQGKIFVFRCAGSLVKCLGAVEDKDLLKKEEMLPEETEEGGIIAVGSHTDKTTRQLKKLLELDDVEEIAFCSSVILEGEEETETEIKRCLILEEEAIQKGKTAVVYTEREVMHLPGESREEALALSVKISEAFLRLVRDLKVKPAFVLAKGGITSSDIGVKALGVRKALVLGQIRPGVPVWKTDRDSRFPDIPYIIFPGNVGDDETLKEAVQILTKENG